ncbi:hypothetical protein F5Y19DRAFT_22867 [Xylariaceae sp. FL1651]|nr:hypothetical protein F5Y19DRAFT_22867 [Xylariaceae sp. FL1651]
MEEINMPKSHRLGRLEQSPETPWTMCCQIRDVICSCDSPPQGLHFRAVSFQTRQSHDWRRYEGTGESSLLCLLMKYEESFVIECVPSPVAGFSRVYSNTCDNDRYNITLDNLTRKVQKNTDITSRFVRRSVFHWILGLKG